jgi:hypothetical protein
MACSITIMSFPVLGIPGKALDRFVETLAIGVNGTRQFLAWFLEMNRIGILGYAHRKFPDCSKQLDGGDKRVMRAFVDPESFSNTMSLLIGRGTLTANSELRLSCSDIVAWLNDAFGIEAAFDNSFVERQPGAEQGEERWVFINGIVTSRAVARRNVYALNRLFERPFTLIHNPTQGLTLDLTESALEKFTNINTEPAARAFLEVGNMLLDDTAKKIVIVAHSQGTIIMGDVLDLIYVSIDKRFFDRTNMNDEDYVTFINTSTGTVKASEMKDLAAALQAKGAQTLRKLELYMFANAASRMCYADENERYPFIESYANEHDIVARLGSLARNDFHREDLIRIDGSLFTLDRYGHLLNAHYLPDFASGDYRLRNQTTGDDIGASVHDPVLGNPCLSHPKHVRGPERSRLLQYRARAKRHQERISAVPPAVELS